MRHLKKGKKFGRLKGPRQHFLRNLASDLIRKEKIETTVTRAKAIRPIVEKLITPQGLLKGVAQEKLLGPGDLEDYAYVSAGLAAYARLTQSETERELARQLATLAWEKFHTARGWRLEQQPLLARPYYQRIVPDGASYSPAALLIKTSWELGGKDLRSHALGALNSGYALLDQGVFWYATQVSAMNGLK